MNIVFVCTGNTCRSPMAEGLMKKYLADRKIENIEVSSAGLSAFIGDEPTDYAIEAAKKLGVDISKHLSQRISTAMLDECIFVGMTSSHTAVLNRYVDKKNVYILGNEVPDPYGGTQEEYDACANAINDALDGLFNEIVRRNTVVEEMSEEHVEEIAKIEKDCFARPWSENALREEIENDQAFFLSANFNSTLIGYIGVIEICGEANITNVAVNASYRRCGVADKLLTEAENGALARNCCFITLEVRPSNSAAISLYKKHGYSEEGRRKGFYDSPKEDAMLMTKFFIEEQSNEDTQH